MSPATPGHYDEAIASFVTAVRSLTKAEKTLSRLSALCAQADAASVGLTTSQVRRAMEPRP